jgi:hypothetical protein
LYEYTRTDEEKKALESPKDMKGEDFLELVKKTFLEYSDKQKVFASQAIQVDPQSLVINEPLAKEDFSIDYPKGTQLFDLSQEGVYTVGKPEKEMVEKLAASAEATPDPLPKPETAAPKKPVSRAAAVPVQGRTVGNAAWWALAIAGIALVVLTAGYSTAKRRRRANRG